MYPLLICMKQQRCKQCKNVGALWPCVTSGKSCLSSAVCVLLHFCHVLLLMFYNDLSIQTENRLCFFDLWHLWSINPIVPVQHALKINSSQSEFSSYFGPSLLPGDTVVLSSTLSSIKGRTFDTGGLAEWLPWSFPRTLAKGVMPLHREKPLQG